MSAGKKSFTHGNRLINLYYKNALAFYSKKDGDFRRQANKKAEHVLVNPQLFKKTTDRLLQSFQYGKRVANHLHAFLHLICSNN